ncbi:MAG: ABC transporter ATP-binding protein [Ferruginibacter sp.]
MSTVIKVENLSKQYRLGSVGTGSIAHDLNRWWQTMRGREDPYLTVGDENDRSVKGDSEYVWALKDINFEVKQGEVLGIIGRNGAGKSTLLKILSRTTSPTSGSVKIKGRVASLLEVGTGFHPELSGRENIFLNGAILGMSKQEIKGKFDEIVDFSGVERYIGTPVKRYSSGMYVRLAFAVAAHLDPEILIVDEVLAVGDAEFQRKAMGKMKDISKFTGRTVLFVSHNLSSINKLCNVGIIMNNGKIIMSGTIDKVLDKYSALGNKEQGKIYLNRELEIANPDKKMLINGVKMVDGRGHEMEEFSQVDEVNLQIDFTVLQSGTAYNVGFELWSHRYDCIFTSKLFDTNFENLNTQIWVPGTYSYRIKIPLYLLKDGNYFVTAAAAIPAVEMLDVFPGEVGFTYNDFESPLFKSGEGRNGAIIPMLEWQMIN